MSEFMEDVMGRKFDHKKLKVVLRRENRSLNYYRDYFQELPGKFLSNNLTSEMYKLFFTHILLGTSEAEHYFKQLLEDVRNAPLSNGEIRILWAHTVPYWQDSINNVLNFSHKYHLLCCDLISTL